MGAQGRPNAGGRAPSHGSGVGTRDRSIPRLEVPTFRSAPPPAPPHLVNGTGNSPSLGQPTPE